MVCHVSSAVKQTILGTLRLTSCSRKGWSYGLDGKLAKAPGVQDVKTFEKAQNGLFPIHVHIDQRGFIWVNLENSETPTVSWGSLFEGSDTHPRLEQFKMDEYVFDHAWSMEGEYNWKACVDNYNEVSNVLPGLDRSVVSDVNRD